MARTGELVPAGPAMWARRDLRRRWRSLVVLGVLAGLAAGLAMASLAGARRTETAFPRLRSVTRSADAVVFPSQIGSYPGKEERPWAKLRAEPYVKAVAPWNLLFGTMDGEFGLLFGPVDRTWLRTIDKPVVVAGRMYDPSNPREVVVDEESAKQLPVGSHFTFQFYANGASDLDGKPPAGPTVRFTVVGVIRETSAFLFTSGLIIPSPALLEQHRDITLIENAHVQLRDPARDMSKLKRDAPGDLYPGTPVLDLHQVERRVSTAISVEHSALLLLAASVAAAGFVFVGQALARSVATVDADADVLSAVGFTPRDLTVAAVLPHLLVAAIGAVGGLAVALALSPRFPIGYAARVDPSRGFHADLTVLVPGTVLTAIVIFAGALTSSWLRRRRSAEAAAAARPSLVARLSRLGPVPVGLGATMAFDGGRGRRAVPVRPALVGAVVAVLGLTATLTIRHGLDEALADPARVGVTWDATLAPGQAAFPPKRFDHLAPAYTEKVTSTRGVTDVAVVWRSVDDVSGVGVAAFAVDSIRGDIDLVALAGHGPVEDDEVAIGPATARQLGVDIGDRIEVGGRSLRIVGRALFPVDVHSGFDEGIWTTHRTLLAVSPPTDPEKGEGPSPTYAVRFAPGIKTSTGMANLTRNVPDSGGVEPAEIPAELSNLRNVRTVPGVLAAFLVLLGVSTLIHVLVASVRARRHDFAVLRAIGFSRRMSATVVGSHGTAVALVGLVIGLPVGFAVGRGAWVWVSDRVPIVYASPLWVTLLVIVCPVAVIAANLIAAWPARRASRLQPAQILRTE